MVCGQLTARWQQPGRSCALPVFVGLCHLQQMSSLAHRIHAHFNKEGIPTASVEIRQKKFWKVRRETDAGVAVWEITRSISIVRHSLSARVPLRHFVQAVFAEYIATLLFIFISIGCVVMSSDGGITIARQTQVAMVFGYTITALVYTFAGISGANMNPAVSWALMLGGKISPLRWIFYTVAQLLGAMSGAGLVYASSPEWYVQVNGGINAIQPTYTATEALAVEIGATALLVIAVMAVSDRLLSARKHLDITAPLVIGIAVSAAHFICVPVTDCSVNPARSFGTSVVMGKFPDHWIFWVGPYLGSTLAVVAFLIVGEDEEEEGKKKGDETVSSKAAASVLGVTSVAVAA